MKPRVLVTRSQPGADATAATLRSRGLEAIVEPVISLENIEADVPGFDALAFTSLNAVRRFREMSAWRDGPVWCVGDRTAAEARDSGYQDVRSAAGSVTDLIEMLIMELPAEARLVHAGNEESRGDLAGSLSQERRNATFLPIYRSTELTAPTPRLAAVLDGREQVHCVLIHSPKAARALRRLTKESDTAPSFAVASISPNASGELSDLGIRVETADHPSETALLAAMDRILSGA